MRDMTFEKSLKAFQTDAVMNKTQQPIIETMRQLFEEKVYPSFPGIANGLRRKSNDEYVSDSLEDHWQTFQEGFEMGMLHIENMIDGKIGGVK